MDIRGRRESTNASFKRATGKKVAAGGGIGGIIIVIIYLIMSGGDLSSVFSILGGNNAISNTNQTEMAEVSESEMTAQELEYFKYAKVVLAATEEVWAEEFRKIGKTYREPKLQAFAGGSIQSACGYASSATGPFYCPGDECVYLDLSFFQEMESKYAKGDFPMAYVIAHEVGHHVQNLLGTLDEMNRYRGKISEKDYNQLNVRLELQADFYAGLWSNKSQSYLSIDDGDINEALTAASAIGDDRLQKQAQGYVVPDSFTHGTSAQRSRWFKRGFTTGDLNSGNTFEVDAANL